jgi:hypothetical protein
MHTFNNKKSGFLCICGHFKRLLLVELNHGNSQSYPHKMTSVQKIELVQEAIKKSIFTHFVFFHFNTFLLYTCTEYYKIT